MEEDTLFMIIEILKVALISIAILVGGSIGGIALIILGFNIGEWLYSITIG